MEPGLHRVLVGRRGGTRLIETWEFLPEGLAMFADKFGDRAADEIEDRTRHAHAGIPQTLAAIKQIAETA